MHYVINKVLYILPYFLLITRRDLQSIAIAMVKNCNKVKREKGAQLWMLIYDLMY